MADEDEKIDFNGYVALSVVRHGEKDGSVTTFNPGDSVEELDYDTLVALLGSDSIGEPAPEVRDMANENARLNAEIATLRAALEAQQGQANLLAEAGSGREVMSDADNAKADAATAASQQGVATSNAKPLDVKAVADNKEGKSTESKPAGS